MENLPSAYATFQFTNLTNRPANPEVTEKKNLVARAKKVLANHPKTVILDQNANFNSSYAPNYLSPTLQLVSPDLNAQASRPENCHSNGTRILKKVNVDFFRAKKVIFKHSNVRISFEIVNILNN